jgi:hypothetical protein
MALRDVIVFVLLVCITPAATGEVSTRVCVADGNGLLLPVDSNLPVIEYPKIMVGTTLTIIVYSNVAG